MSKSHSLWSVLALVLVTGLGGCLPSELFSTPTSTPTPVRPRQIAKNTLGLHEYWRVPHTCLGGSQLMSLAAISGRVVCNYYDSASTDLSVRVFDAARGTLLWEAVGQPGTGKVTVDARRVYFENNLELHTYDLENGQQLWKMPLTGHRGHLYNPQGEKLDILESGSGVPWILYTLDARTGDTLNSESVSTDDGFILFARFPQFDLYYGLLPHSALRAVNPVTHQVRWQITEPGILSTPNWPPVLLEDVLLIDLVRAVIAFDAQSGQVRWRSNADPYGSELKSLFATQAIVLNGSLYALGYDGRLVRLDPRTGRETGYIQFVPTLPDQSPIDKFFALATDGKMLFVSFDDSNELIALGP